MQDFFYFCQKYFLHGKNNIAVKLFIIFSIILSSSQVTVEILYVVDNYYNISSNLPSGTGDVS